MLNEPAEMVQVKYTPEFKRNLRALVKKYRHIRSDIQPVIDQLCAGKVIGDQVPRTH
jgi:mRNA-degrading endonuclease RelE of RelBE toxin-antitoxin system